MQSQSIILILIFLCMGAHGDDVAQSGPAEPNRSPPPEYQCVLSADHMYERLNSHGEHLYFIPLEMAQADPSCPKAKGPAIDRAYARCADAAQGLEPIPALKRQLETSEYLFLGETHLSNQERFIIQGLPELKKSGVRFIAIELATSQKSNLEKFMSTGDPKSFSSPWDVAFAEGSEYSDLVKAAKALNLTVVPIDHPRSSDRNLSGLERDSYMAQQLSDLPRSGKKLVITGSVHAERGDSRHTTARGILSQSRRTAGAKMESLSGIETSINYGLVLAMATGTNSALWLCKDLIHGFPLKSVAASASTFNTLKYLSPTYSMEYSEGSEYGRNFDVILFLSRTDTLSDKQ